MPKQIGWYNATHKHGEPMENMLRKLKAKRAGGTPGRGATRSSALDLGGKAVNRANAPVREMPAWVARQMAAGKGLSGTSVPGVTAQGGVPEGVTPTKPIHTQGGKATFDNPYPGGPETGRPVLKRRRRRV